MFKDTGDCEDCVSAGEKAFAILGLFAGALIVVFAIDLLTGGAISGRVDALAGKAEEVVTDE